MAAEKAKIAQQATTITYTNTTVSNSKSALTLLTAYSSSVDETNGNPNITASGARTHWGVVAANHLAIGTKIKIPSLFGDKVFTVLDRMHPKNYGKIDVWFPSKSQALQFGVKRAEIVVL